MNDHIARRPERLQPNPENPERNGSCGTGTPAGPTRADGGKRGGAPRQRRPATSTAAQTAPGLSVEEEPSPNGVPDRSKVPPPPVVAVDELTVRYSIDWGPETPAQMEKLLERKRAARYTNGEGSELEILGLRELAAVKLGRVGLTEAFRDEFEQALSRCPAVVMSSGAGKGERHMPYIVKLGPGGCIVVDVSPNASRTRQRPNVKVRITGLACTVLGVSDADALALAFVEWLGGVVRDRWVRNLHVCADEVGESPEAYFERARSGRMVSTSHKGTLAFDRSGDVQLALGTSTRCRVSIYDKAKELRHRQSSGKIEDLLYVHCWLQRHGLDEIPRHCTRVEYQLGRDWLREHGGDTADDVMEHLPGMVERLVAGKRPPCRFTARKVTAGNQSRAGTMRRWNRLMAAFAEWLGPPALPLPAVEKAKLSPRRSLRCMISYSAAVTTALGISSPSVFGTFRQAHRALINEVGGKLEEMQEYHREACQRYRRRFDAELWRPVAPYWAGASSG